MKMRHILLSVAMGVALYLVLTAFLFTCYLRAGSHAASAGLSLPIQTAETALPDQDEGYLIRTVEDEVCIFQNGQLILHTGVIASLLPQQDREALETGITAADQAALTALLEDLGS